MKGMNKLLSMIQNNAQVLTEKLDRAYLTESFVADFKALLDALNKLQEISILDIPKALEDVIAKDSEDIKITTEMIRVKKTFPTLIAAFKALQQKTFTMNNYDSLNDLNCKLEKINNGEWYFVAPAKWDSAKYKDEDFSNIKRKSAAISINRNQEVNSENNHLNYLNIASELNNNNNDFQSSFELGGNNNISNDFAMSSDEDFDNNNIEINNNITQHGDYMDFSNYDSDDMKSELNNNNIEPNDYAQPNDDYMDFSDYDSDDKEFNNNGIENNRSNNLN